MTDPSEVPNSALSVHLCGPEDRAEQARLFNAVFKKQVDAEALAWRYDRNPQGSSVSFVARPPGGDGICGYACSPRRFVPRGDESCAALIGETGDVMTHPDWRKRGIFSSLDAACMEETKRRGWPAIFGLPNRHSAHIFLKLGWEQVGTIRHRTFLLKADAAARAERFREGRLGAWLTPFAARRMRRTRTRLEAAAAELVVKPLERFPDEVEALSKAREPEFSIMVRRDAAYLNWRFRDNPSRMHRAFGVWSRSGEEFLGYAVLQVPRGDRKAWLVDLLAADERAELAAVSAALDAAQELDASIVQANAIDGSHWDRLLERCGFVPPKETNFLIVIRYVHDPEHPVVTGAREAAGWYLTDGDRDDETVG